MTSGRFTGKYLSEADIEKAISEVISSSSDFSSFVLVGGVALQLYGSERLTRNVDFIAEEIPPGFEIIRTLSIGGAATKSPSGLPVDFIVPSGEWKDLYENIAENAEKDPALGLKIASVEQIIAMKMVAGRAKDTLDIESVLIAGAVDLKKAEAFIRKHLGAFAAREFSSLADEIAWRIRDRGR